MPYGTINADQFTTSDGVTSSGLYGFKNRIINGAMVIDQRNAGASVSTSSATNGNFQLDRWKTFIAGTAVVTAQQSSTAPTGFINSQSYTVATADSSIAAGDLYVIEQPIEGLNCSDLSFGSASASTMTLSFWVRSSITGTYCGALTNSAENRAYIFTYTISAANTWEQKTVTITGDTSGTWLTTSGIGIRIRFALAAGSTFQGTANTWSAANVFATSSQTQWVSTLGATFYITGVQLEKGSTATSFDYRPYGTELALCQRYFEKSFPQATASAQNSGEKAALLYVNSSDGGSLAGFTPFKVTKRASPTIVGYNPSAANSNFSNGGTANFHVVDDTGLGGYTTTLTGARATINWTASAEL